MVDRAELYKEAVRTLRHDSRNLLNGIGIMAEHFDAVDDAKGRQFSKYLQDKVAAMVRVGERADVIANLGEPLPEKHSVASLVEKAMARLEESDPPFALELGDASAMCDAQLTVMALEEILRNAAATKAKVSVRTEEQDGALVIVVSDEGPGVPEPALPTLFTPYRGAKRPGGSSLGLPLAQMAMHGQGGDVSLQSEFGQGTTVRLTFARD